MDLNFIRFIDFYEKLLPRLIRSWLRIHLRRFLIRSKFFFHFNNQNLNFLPKFLKISLIFIKKIIKEIISKLPLYIISYPKCGRTWLRFLIGNVLCEKFNLSDKYIVDTYRLTKAAGLNPTIFTHDDSDYQKIQKYNKLNKKKKVYKNYKVIFLIRNIKDVLVSNYFQTTRREYIFEGNLSEFVRSEKFGVRRVITFYNLWYENRYLPKQFLLIRYEDLHKNPKKNLIKILKYIGLKSIENNILEKAIELSKFETMKKLEKKKIYNDIILKPGNSNDPESYKVRKGIIGGYLNYLSKEDIEYIDRMIKRFGCPFEENVI